MLDTLKNGYENSYAPPETLSLITSLKEERAKFFDSFKYLKKILGEEVRRDKEQLKHLTVITDEVTNVSFFLFIYF